MTTAGRTVPLETVAAATPAELDELMRGVADARRMTPEELAAVAQKLVDATDPDEVFALKKLFFSGFYGTRNA